MACDHMAVIDIGKTNKKVLLYDRSLRLVEQRTTTIDEIVDGDLRLENLDAMETWLWDTLRSFADRVKISAVSVATHGASMACLDEAGAVCVPPVAYTTEADEAFRGRFFERCGDPSALQRETATAEIGSLINLGKLVAFVQERFPDAFAKTRAILNFPQYFGYRLTEVVGAEPTYVGCHTYLFDPRKRAYSSVADRLGIRDLLPRRIARSWERLGTITPAMQKRTGLPADCLVTMGIHDSNASLLPYLVQQRRSFALNSTGTWCVAMHPASSLDFAEAELGKTVFYNLDAFFNPVKTSIFLGGMEWDTYTSMVRERHGALPEASAEYAALPGLCAASDRFIVPSVMQGIGVYPHSAPRVLDGAESFPLDDIRSGNRIPPSFDAPATACAMLDLALAVQTVDALSLTGYDGTGDLYIEGGFQKNEPYRRIVAALYPDARVCISRIKEATAFGAALLAEAALQGKDPAVTRDLFTIDTTVIEPIEIPGLADYARAYRSRVANARA